MQAAGGKPQLRSIALDAVVHVKVDADHPRHCGFQPAIGMQAQPAVARRFLIDLKSGQARLFMEMQFPSDANPLSRWTLLKGLACPTSL